MDDFFRHNFPTGNYSDSTTASGRHHVVFDFSTPPPVKYAPHSSPSLGHNYLVHSWSICVCFHSTADGLNPNSFTSFVSFHAFYCSSVWGANPAKPKQILSWFALSMPSDGWVKTSLRVSRDLLRTTVKDRSRIFTTTDFEQFNRI